VNVGPELAPDEPLSPELVLVLPAELRAQAIARLGPPAWPAPRPRPVVAPPPVLEAPVLEAPALEAPVLDRPPAVDESFARYVGALVAARLAQLALIFVFVTIVTLALSLVANAFK
jgi:hypothetical protein